MSFWEARYMFASVLLGQILLVVNSTFTAWSSPMLIKLDADCCDNPLGRKISDDENSWLASISLPGSVCGSLLFAVLSVKIGRKTLLTVIAIPFIIFYWILAFSSNIWLFYIARFLGGLAGGGMTTILPMYICEISDAKNRGKLCACMAVTTNIGVVLTFVLGPYMSWFWFHMGLSIIPIIFLPLFYFFAVESPHYVLQKDFDEAEAIMKKIRGTGDVMSEMKEIQKGQENQAKGSVVDMFRTRGIGRALIMGVGIISFTLLTGVEIITAYTTKIFKLAGGSLDSQTESIILSLVQVGATFISFLTSDKFGRKALFAFSFSGIAVSEILLGLYFVFQNDSVFDSLGWLPLVSLIGFVVSFNVGVGPLGVAIACELFPIRIKNVAVSFIIVYFGTGSFLLTFFFNRLVNSIGIGYTFWMFSVCSMIAIIFVKYCVLETKGKTLQQIQEQLSA